MQIHPFLENSTYYQMPSQNLSIKDKDEDWRKANMDALENNARIQFTAKYDTLIKNYKMVNGELVMSEYVSEEDKDATAEFLSNIYNTPDKNPYEKHYDIISQPLSTLEGELDSFPDVFNVVGKGDMMDSERMKVKTQMLKEWFEWKMYNEIASKQTTEEDEFFKNEEQEEQEIPPTPPEIEKYMSSGYRHILEQWAQLELEDQFERFKIKSLRREQFHHYLVAGEHYRHIYKDRDELKARAENPLYVASHKSPSLKYTQLGDWATVARILSVSSIIDEFGHLMTDEQINELQSPYKSKPKDKGLGTDIAGNKINYLSPYGVPYQTRVTALDPFIRSIPSMKDMGNTSGYFFTPTEMSKINGWGDNILSNVTAGMCVVVKGYWKSQLRVGKLTWINPVTKLYEIKEVDDNFVVPAYIKEIKDEKYNYVGVLNTIVWTRITEIWEGIKITNYGSDGYLENPMYLDIKPCDIQIGRLPICGQFASNLNTKPTSFVDKIKNYQFLYNILMNEFVHFLITEWLPYVAVDVNDLPNDKDWGGEEALEKYADTAQEGGVVPVNPSPENRGGSNSGGQYPKVIDMDRTTRLITRINIAAQIRQLAREQVGMTPQRMAEVKATETATGVNQAVTSSNNQTASYFAEFFEAEKEALQFQIDAAKYLQSRSGDFSAQVVKSDLSLQALKFSIEDGDLYDLHIYISDNQEELRKLETARRLALENNTSNLMMSDRLEMSVNSNYRDILSTLKKSEEQAVAQQQQEFQLKQQELQQQGYSQQEALRVAQENFITEQQVKIHIATLQALGHEEGDDMNANGLSDILEYNKTIGVLQGLNNTATFNNAKLNVDREKNILEQSYKEKELRDRREERKNQLKLAQLKLKQAAIAGDKSK